MDDFTIMLPDIVKALGKELTSILPDSDDVSRWDLESQRKIWLDYDVGYNMMEIQRLIMRWNIHDEAIRRAVVAGEDDLPLHDPNDLIQPIWIYIMSYGGDLDFMWSLIDTISLSKTPVYTVNVGMAASAASLIFLAGHKRFMMPTSRLVIHEGSAQITGDAVKVMDQSESYKKQLKQMKEYILSRTDIPRSLLMKRRSNDWEIDAKFCLENKACDVIVSSIDELI